MDRELSPEEIAGSPGGVRASTRSTTTSAREIEEYLARDPDVHATR